MFYIGAWAFCTGTARTKLRKALSNGDVNATDTVWCGPSGDAVVAATAADLTGQYADYVDKGLVSEFVRE